MKLRHLSMFVVALGLCALVPNRAEAEFTQTVSHAYAAKSSLKVTEPAGFKIAITLDGKNQEDTIPHVFALPDQDAYVPVTITAPDGKNWSGKIEVKSHQQTQLAFKYTAAPAAAPEAKAKAARKFIGHLNNNSNVCHEKLRIPVKYDLLDETGATVSETVLTSGQEKQLDLPAGNYEVRVFFAENNAWRLNQTFKDLQINADKWGFSIGCARRNGTQLTRTK
jgi:hypothetical protein